MRKKPKPLKVIVTYGERPTAQQFFCSLYNVTPSEGWELEVWKRICEGIDKRTLPAEGGQAR